MKKFLKKANRGLLLGAVVIIVLLIYVIYDYRSFNSEKSIIKETIENYMEDYYQEMSENDYEAMVKIITEAWTGREVMTNDGYYVVKDVVVDCHDSLKTENKAFYTYANPQYSISSMSIRKWGPGMALATITYELSVEGPTGLEIVTPFEDYASGFFYEEEDKNTYVYENYYEYTVYLVKEDGQWKISQSTGWCTGMNYYVKGEK